MAVTKKGRGIASQSITSNTDTAGEKFAVDASTRSMIASMTISSRTDGTYTLKIQHSHNGTNWEDLVTGSGVTTNDTVYVEYAQAVDGACFGQIRIVITSASVTTGATAEADIWFD